MKTSVMGAINMLGLAKRVNAKILQASTSEVYDPLVHPQPESYWGHVNPIGKEHVMTRKTFSRNPIHKLSQTK
jgi:UDP-glucuronate decarboxylase